MLQGIVHLKDPWSARMLGNKLLDELGNNVDYFNVILYEIK